MTNKFQYEEDVLKFWQENEIFKKVEEKNKLSKQYTHVDGPPFPTGEIHVGHLRNWAVKDSVLRFKRYQGYNVYARDGYDVNGLPVESKVQKKLNLSNVDELKEFGEDNFVKECKKFVGEVIHNMKDRRERYGLWMNRNHYSTADPNYLSLAWSVFKKAHEKDLLYKDFKVVAWSPGAETTLSDYEIKDSYAVLEDPSIYVKYKLKDTTTNYEESLVIWTTTPWTLQSNIAVAVNPEFTYVKALVELNSKKEVLLVAKELLDHVIKTISKSNTIKLIEVLQEIKGVQLEGTKYEHVLLEETPSQKEFLKLENKFIHSIVLADFVTLGGAESHLEKIEKRGSYKHSNKEESQKQEETKENSAELVGTGLVHIAPGHGMDDFAVGKKFELPIFSPLNSKAIITEGKFEGMFFKDADKHIIQYLTNNGKMVHSELKSHRYPLCWRTKVPICYRAVDQWWFRRSKVIEGMVKENQNVHWYPNFARDSFNNLMEKAGDWAISRQRFWGIPLPIFEDEDGNYEVFGSKEELEERIGKKLNDIHRDDLREIEIINPVSKKPAKAVPYITDVWFDSGCASFASHYGEGLDLNQIIEKYYPMNWITEGEDQIRGWFSSLFTVGYILTGKAPYNQVLFQQFVMAADGQKMSKSLGNGIEGNEALELFGADATRYYLLSKAAPESKLNFDQEELKEVYALFNTIENITKFVNSYLQEYELSNFPTINLSSLDVEDKWILYKLNSTIKEYTHLYENFKFNLALKELENFIVNDYSKTYLKLIKDRTEQRDENLLNILSTITKKILILLSPVIPFKTEQLYKQLVSTKRESIFLEEMPEHDEMLIKEVEKQGIEKNFELAQEVVQAILNAREKVKIGVRWPLSQVDIISSNSLLSSDLEVFENLIKKLTNIMKISYSLDEVDVEYNIKPNFNTIKDSFGNPGPIIGIINKNKNDIIDSIKAGLSKQTFDNIEIVFDTHLIKEVSFTGEVTSSDFSQGSVVLHTHQDEILLEEGYLREVIRRIQATRKDLNCNKSDLINLSLSGSDEYFVTLSENWENLICKKVGAKEIVKNQLNDSQEFEIKDKKLIISIQKI